MTGYVATTKIGRVTPGEVDTVWVPRTVRGGYGVVLIHGTDAPGEFIDHIGQPSSVLMAARVAGEGIPCITSEFYGNAWGNNNHMAAIERARLALAAECPTMNPAKIFVLGVSMGGAAAARFAQLYPDRTAGVVGIIPAYDIRYEYEHFPAIASVIATAWGFTNGDPLPAAADNAAHAVMQVPHLTGYSTVDTVVPPAPVLAYNAAVGGTAVITDTTYGHSDAAVGGMPISTLTQFLAANGA